VLGGPDRHLARNLLIGGLVGLLLGSAAMFVLASPTPRTVVVEPDDSEVRKREQLLDQRVSGVSQRERALAAHAGKLAAREQELEARAARLTELERELEERAAASAPPPPSEPVPGPTPEVVPESADTIPVGAWNLDELERMVDAATGATSEQLDEWRTYLFYLREHARHDGALPRSLDPLISHVFADLADRWSP
jgi:DNA repair exonuclease SbcCD ATPase subunit